MSAIPNIDSVYRSMPYTGAIAKPADPELANKRFAGDTVEFSRLGRDLARGVQKSSLRLARMRAIRAEISAGTYETPERIDVTARRILNVIA